jgi:chemotaxis methyl-accepting protein methylase
MVETLPVVLQLVRDRTGVDFSQYREATMQRRVQNHMVSLGATVPSEYVAILQDSHDATFALLERLTIKVSAFYRNPVTFDEIRARVIPELAASRSGPLNVWSAGCSRGEEPYTIAMLLVDAGVDGTIVATDIDAKALSAGEEGVYEAHSVASLPEDLREKFLEPVQLRNRPAFRVTDAIRSRVQFRRHDLTRERPPSSVGFDLLTCRNVLIYLQRDMHHTVLRTLRTALAPGGFLCLGEAEWPTPDVIASLSPFPRKTRLFRAIDSAQAGGFNP